MVRILIVDDHAIVREGMRKLIHTHPAWHVCGEAGEGRTALAMARKLSPDVAIVDVALPGMSGLVLVRRLREECPTVRTLLFSFRDDEETVADGLAAGALGYVLKSESSQALEAGISAVVRGRTYISSPLLTKTVAARHTNKHSPLETLTPRELEVVQLVAEGKSNKEIAHVLHISTKTVEVHRASAMRRVDLRSIADLVRFAIRHNLITT